MFRLTAAATLALLLALPALAGEPVKAGRPLKGLTPARLSAVLAKPEDGQEVRLEGKIEKVCKNKGCWLVLKQGESEVHVTFEDYSFFVPTDSSGKNVILEGKVKVAEPDAAAVEHLKAEGAGETVTRKVTVVASGVEVHEPTRE